VIFPELLRGVLARDTGEDLLSACAIAASDHFLCSLEDGVGSKGCKGGNTWMFILEGGQIVDILVDSDVQVVWLIVCRDVCLREGFRHLALCNLSQSCQNQTQ
jgi:hypothetical protein